MTLPSRAVLTWLSGWSSRCFQRSSESERSAGLRAVMLFSLLSLLLCSIQALLYCTVFNYHLNFTSSMSVSLPNFQRNALINKQTPQTGFCSYPFSFFCKGHYILPSFAEQRNHSVGCSSKGVSGNALQCTFCELPMAMSQPLSRTAEVGGEKGYPLFVSLT